MRIIYLTDQIYLHGGVEKVLAQKANWLSDEAEDEVHIITTRQQGNAPVYRFSEKIVFHDLAVDYDIEKSYFHPENLKRIRPHFKRLSVLLQKLQPDVVISCNFAPDFYFLPFILKKVPKIKEFHGSRALERGYGIKDTLLKRLNRNMELRYDGLAVLNRDELKYYPGDRKYVLPNPAEVHTDSADLSSKVVLAAGRLSPVKNFSELLEIWKLVSDRFPDWQLHIYGQDYLNTAAKLQRFIDDNQLNGARLMGVGEMKEAMAKSSIYAMTSVSECFPMVLLEALSFGIPVVSYDCPTGPGNILSPDDSFLIENHKKGIFAERLIHLMGNEELRSEMGRNGARNVRRFMLDKVMRDWKALFTELIRKRSKGV